MFATNCGRSQPTASNARYVQNLKHMRAQIHILLQTYRNMFWLISIIMMMVMMMTMMQMIMKKPSKCKSGVESICKALLMAADKLN